MFTGSRRENVDDWIFTMRLYLITKGVPADLQTVTAASFLVGDALRWFQALTVRTGQLSINFNEFETGLRAQFAPINESRNARDKLANLVQERSVRSYIQEFQRLCLRITDMSEAEKLDRFLRGLKRHVRVEVELREPHTFDEAARMAERVDVITFERRSESPRENMGVAPMEIGTLVKQQPPFPQRRGLSVKEKDTLREQNRCYHCKEKGHIAQRCPKRNANYRPRRVRINNIEDLKGNNQ